MSVRYNVHFDVQDRERFESLAAEAMNVTVGQPGTLKYEWFINDDGTKATLEEEFADDEATLAHLAAVGPELLPQLLETSAITDLQMLGPVSDTIRDAYAQLGPTHMSALQPRAVH